MKASSMIRISSDPGSAIEGLGQKIPLDDELADLGV